MLRQWFSGLASREQDIIRRHICATPPVSLEEIASQHRTFRNVIHKLRNDLPQSLQDFIEDNAELKREIKTLEREIGAPVSVLELLSGHAWLTEEVAGVEITALDLLCGLKWPGALQGGWVFDGDIDREKLSTLEVLSFEPGETMTLQTAARIIGAAGMRFNSDELVGSWLSYCGLKIIGCQVIREVSEGAADSHKFVSVTLGDRGAIPERIAAKVSTGDVDRAVLVESLPAAQSARRDGVPFVGVLARLGTLAAQNGWRGQFGELLRDADLLSGELGELARWVRGAFLADEGTWQLDSDVKSEFNSSAENMASKMSPTELAADSQVATANVSAENVMELSLVNRVVALLADSKSSLSTSQVVSSLDTGESEAEVSRALFSDDRIAISASGGWYFVASNKSFEGEEEGKGGIVGSSRSEQNNPEVDPDNENSLSRENITDTVARILSDTGHPLPVHTLLLACNSQTTGTSLKRKLESDTRFHLSDRELWALTEWGMPSYKPIKELIADMVDESGGSVPSYEVIKKLTAAFSIKESSLRQAMSSPPFTARNGVVRRLEDLVEGDQGRMEWVGHNNESGEESDVPSAVELMKDLGLDF
jgi:hypothetical protein